MSAANPSNFDYYKRAEPPPVLNAKTANTGFDYFRRNEPYIGFVMMTLLPMPNFDGTMMNTLIRM